LRSVAREDMQPILASTLEGSDFPAFTMLVKWHTKPHAVKRSAKHPRCFHDYKDHHPLSTWSVFYSHVAFASGASCTVCALLAPSPSSPASSPSLQGGFEERVILTSTAGSFRHNVATYGSHRRISSLRSSRRCPDSADRSSV
jgi:hypothetical protein